MTGACGFGEIGEGRAARVAPGATRAFQAGLDGLELLAFGRRRRGGGELICG
jgi:hypothetical protein